MPFVEDSENREILETFFNAMLPELPAPKPKKKKPPVEGFY